MTATGPYGADASDAAGSVRSRATSTNGDVLRVWRDGNRIRKADSTGYGDIVPDDSIVLHAMRHLAAGEWDDAAFCVATLALRARERGQAVPEGTRLLTNWGPAAAGRTWPDDPNQEVVYLPGALGAQGADIAGATGAFPLPEVRRWAALAADQEAPPASCPETRQRDGSVWACGHDAGHDDVHTFWRGGPPA